MKKVLFLKGLPASGKSTFAKELLEREPDKWVRVNKDELRIELHNGVWSKENEKVIVSLHQERAEKALVDGFSVIVDDTNFHAPHEDRFRAVAEKHGAEFEVMNFEINLDEAIERDSKRGEKSVGREVIRKMYNQYIKPKVYESTLQFIDGLPDAIIADVDGTLAIMKDRGPFDWFRVGQDTPHKPVVNLVNTYYDLGYQVIILTGRDGVCLPHTKEWLEKHGIKYHHIFIRDAGNNEKDAIIKKRIFDEHIRGKFNVHWVVDDRDQVVKMWRREVGLTVLQCNEGDF